MHFQLLQIFSARRPEHIANFEECQLGNQQADTESSAVVVITDKVRMMLTSAWM